MIISTSTEAGAPATSLRELLGPVRVIPVITLQHAADAIPLAEALVTGGLPVLEVTLRTPAGLAAISMIRESVLGAVVGAGTILDADQLRDAGLAGAHFAISPGVTPTLLDAAADYDGIFVPGTANPSEVMTALEHGISEVKFFPAEINGGVRALRALAGPFPQVSFCATGGVGPRNVGDYLALSNVMCVGGSWMLDPEELGRRDWDALARRASETARATTAIR